MLLCEVRCLVVLFEVRVDDQWLFFYGVVVLGLYDLVFVRFLVDGYLCEVVVCVEWVDVEVDFVVVLVRCGAVEVEW